LDSLGWVYFQKKDYQKALETLKKALEASPKEGVIMEHIADVLSAKGDQSAALEFYSRALKTDLDDRDRARIEIKANGIRRKAP
ncbi:MAG: tetratricopeptide repeat protein, partial [Proteobacteria bacterium]|nr:tetratricopeptide repeat protein [Pseudomonadota bacterium]